MSEIVMVGLDPAWIMVQAHGAGVSGNAGLREKPIRDHVLTFSGQLPPRVVAIDACGGAHFRRREIGDTRGHDGWLIPPADVKSLSNAGKTGRPRRSGGRDAIRAHPGAFGIVAPKGRHMPDVFRSRAIGPTCRPVPVCPCAAAPAGRSHTISCRRAVGSPDRGERQSAFAENPIAMRDLIGVTFSALLLMWEPDAALTGPNLDWPEP